jgi:hypothetical protein
MTRWLWLPVLASFAFFSMQRAEPFDFSRTMRVDYVHTGGPKAGETVALDRIVNDGPWPGSRTNLVDSTNLGHYFFEVQDKTGGRVLTHAGFHPCMGSGKPRPKQSALEASTSRSDSLAELARARHAQETPTRHELAAVWSTDVDPGSRFVNAAPIRAHDGAVWTVFEHGPAAQKVDLLVISEGYTKAQLPKFHGDVTRLLDALFAEEPFKSRKRDFNVRALDLPSVEPGINRPNAGVFRRTPISAEYNIFDSERYVLTLDNRALRNHASAAPYEFIEILANEQTYGGGGIFNDQATASVDSAFSEYVFVHEFGHHFAALADEYYTSDVAYETGVPKKQEPWEPNITALGDPRTLKWRDLVATGTPLPTPWDQKSSSSTAAPSRSGGAPSASGMRPRKKWMRSSASSACGSTNIWEG